MVIGENTSIILLNLDDIDDAWLTLTTIQFHLDTCNPVYKGHNDTRTRSVLRGLRLLFGFFRSPFIRTCERSCVFTQPFMDTSGSSKILTCVDTKEKMCDRIWQKEIESHLFFKHAYIKKRQYILHTYLLFFFFYYKLSFISRLLD